MTLPDEGPGDKASARAIAFYLPQFHPIPENDRWWGRGFTEWTNVAAARPLFRGHRQPRLPADLGFYDLRLPEAREAQADLARAHGVEAFCYWHYWFAGTRLLGRPFDEVLATGRPDFPFCLGWANHSWTRTWSNDERQVLVRQNYSPADDAAHARWLADAFADPRHLRVDGRPLLLIYDPAALPSAVATTDAVRAESVRRGLPEPYIVGCSRLKRGARFADFGLDGLVHHLPDFGLFPRLGRDGPRPEKLARNLKLGVPSATLRLCDYAEVCRGMNAHAPDGEHFPGVFCRWDTTPRRGRRGIVVLNATPEAFAAELRRAVRHVAPRPPQERLVFINAWNEWAEGMYLEPDHEHGHAYLEVVRREILGEIVGGGTE